MICDGEISIWLVTIIHVIQIIFKLALSFILQPEGTALESLYKNFQKRNVIPPTVRAKYVLLFLIIHYFLNLEYWGLFT